jgi:hypothetical protein
MSFKQTGRKQARANIRRLRWAPNLIVLIENGELVERVKSVQAEYRALCDALDVWEANNSDLYDQMPWKEGRERWKAEGRPEPHWLDLLAVAETRPCNVWNEVYQQWKTPLAIKRRPMRGEYDREWHRKKTIERRKQREAARGGMPG